MPDRPDCVQINGLLRSGRVCQGWCLGAGDEEMLRVGEEENETKDRGR